MRLLGRDIRSITKRVTRMKSDIADNIARNDTQIALLSEAVTALKDAQDALQAENTTGANIAKSLQVM